VANKAYIQSDSSMVINSDEVIRILLTVALKCLDLEVGPLCIINQSKYKSINDILVFCLLLLLSLLYASCASATLRCL